MNEALKKRLVGAAVLAALTVIFVPMLIDEPAAPEPQIREIPEAPPLQPFASSMLNSEIERPQPVEVDLTVDQADELPPQPQISLSDTASEKSAASRPAQVTPAPAAKPAVRTGLKAWAVQVGSFSNADNAQKLVEKLRKAGFQVGDPERLDRRGKTLYRVRVGPTSNPDIAKGWLPKVNEVSGTKGAVVSFP